MTEAGLDRDSFPLALAVADAAEELEVPHQSVHLTRTTHCSSLMGKQWPSFLPLVV